MFKFCTYTFLTVLTVDLLATSCDLTITWTSPILPKLYSHDNNTNPLHRPITQDEESWIGSLINIGALIGPFPFGFLSQKIGRKMTLLLVSIPNIFSFIFLAVVQDLSYYYAARVLAGISVGAGTALLPLYITEIAEDASRGMLSVTLNVFWTFGNLLPYVLGPYMPIVWFNVALLCFPLAFFVLFWILGPESPYYLVSKGKIFQAEDSLMKLRSKTRAGVVQEIEKIQSSLSENKQSGGFTEMFSCKTNLKALGISLGLIAFQQLSGINVIAFYTEMIFQMAGSSLPPEISSIIIGVTMFLSSLIIPFCADSLGRRVFLILSALGMMISLLIVGTYFYLKETVTEIVNIESFSWLPILGLVAYIASFNFGYGSLPWTVGSELFSVNLKALGASLVSFTCWSVSFIMTKFFNDLNNLMGRAGTFWLFAGLCLLAAVFTWFCVPETKGKSFREIQELLNK